MFATLSKYLHILVNANPDTVSVLIEPGPVVFEVLEKQNS